MCFYFLIKHKSSLKDVLSHETEKRKKIKKVKDSQSQLPEVYVRPVRDVQVQLYKGIVEGY
jgi:hypothetical protein